MRRTHAEPVMGTVVSFDLVTDGVDAADVDDALALACAGLHEIDDVFSTWQPASPVSRLRRGETTLDECPPEVAEVLDRCARARDLTDGWFDPWAMPGGLDPTGLVKGWAAQRALAVLETCGVRSAMVNAGGDVTAIGGPEVGRPWRLGVRHPDDPTRMLAVVPLLDAALATSGTYERGDHVIDPWTAAPSSAGIVSASVVGRDLGLADALATALVAGGPAAARHITAIPGYAALMVSADRRLHVVGDFPGLPVGAGTR